MCRQKMNLRILAALLMTACMLLSCCAAASHTASHACSYYDDCHLCQQLDAGRTFGLLALVILSGCIFLRSRIHFLCEAARRCFVPSTLISQFIQMND